MAERRIYVVAGAVMGGIWAWGSGTPAWEHALRLLVLVVCAAVLMSLAHRRRARLGRPVHRRLHSGLLAGKVLLVAAALLLDQLLGPWVSEPSLITAVVLFAGIAAGGPALHRWLSRGGGGAPDRRSEPSGRRVLSGVDAH
ncbi:hypothetical protein CP980_31360 [Streptomyces vinaceus]|uniref:Uncharacterized protein n=1 Tax=Streptomyces vinaceus TaxID=1960 RepID=A0A5J6JMF9_STRVI|nr:hypothetical protein [Streptomyces vinaceus]QEV48976.1 hypothetical protein CP980_31360 [Streptomyces vinaceus]GHE38969.1 hypothetical protein GCM10017778_22980 [Streptomyces vinaceus]